jgi:hypothetical protein
MLLRLQSKRVHVNTNSRDVGVVLVRLHPIEVVTITHLESVVTVKLQQGSNGRVFTSHTFHASDGVTRLQNGAVPPVGVVEGLLTFPRVDDVIIAAHEGVTLDNPHKLFTRVVEVELELVGRRGNGLTSSELENINQILVRDLGELATLIGIKVDVVNIQRGSSQTALTNAVANGMRVVRVGIVPTEIVESVKLEVNTHFVILKSNQRKSETRVAAKPELQRNVQSVHGGTRSDNLRSKGLTSITVIVATRTTLVQQIGQLGDVTNHFSITSLFTRLLRELVPYMQPVTILLINTLTTDLNFNIINNVVTNPVEPTELSTRTIGRLKSHLRQSSL